MNLFAIAAVAIMLALSAPAISQGNADSKLAPPVIVQSQPDGKSTASDVPRLQMGKAQPEKKQSAKRNRHNGQSTADARSCLQYETNIRIMACAEKYRGART